MSPIEQRINEFEKRPPSVDAQEQRRRAGVLDHFAAISKFEGIVPTGIDKRLFQLYIDGKVTKQEYLELCLTDVRRA